MDIDGYSAPTQAEVPPSISSSGTPRTDAEAFWIREGDHRTQYQGCEYVRAAVARNLEVMMDDALADVGRLIEEKMEFFMRVIELERELAKLKALRTTAPKSP